MFVNRIDAALAMLGGGYCHYEYDAAGNWVLVCW